MSNAEITITRPFEGIILDATGDEKNDLTLFYKVETATSGSTTRTRKRKNDFDFLLTPSSSDPLPAFSVEGNTSLTEVGKEEIVGRGLAALCWRKEHVSITVRAEKNINKIKPKVLQDEFHVISDSKCKYTPPSSAGNGYFLVAEQTCQVLSDFLGFYDISGKKKSFDPKGGLYIISGRTGCGKSVVTRGIIYYMLQGLLEKRAKKERNPHLLTIEKPIEEFLFGGMAPQGIQLQHRIDYTPRELGKDTPDLNQALMKDALRQTPSVVYVGETRTDDEWRTLLDFAKTAHPIVTTAHAGSVKETLVRILKAANATTRAEQGEVAQVIRGIIHLDVEGFTYRGGNCYPNSTGMSEDIDCKKIMGADAGNRVVVPSLWRGTTAGVAALVADGPSSIIPHVPKTDIREAKKMYSIGRTWFFDDLVKKKEILEGYQRNDVFNMSDYKKSIEKLKNNIRKRDLEDA
jgi:hypothetical protein